MSSSKKILIIDDEKSLLKIIEKFLQKLGHSGVTAENGDDGITAFSADPQSFYGVIIDYNLPGKSTEDTLVEIKQKNSEIKVVLSTGFAVNEIAAEFRRVRIDSTLQKPFTITDFKSMIEKL